MYQEIQIIGTIGREPELRYTADGKAMSTFSVATNRVIAGGQKETTWFKVTAFDKLAETVSNYAHKGMKVHTVGRLVCDKNNGGPRLYQKQDGTWTAAFEVVAREFRIVDFAGQGQGQQTQQQQYQPRPQAQAQRPVQQQVQPKQADFTEDIPW